ncbi:MAG: hypothetical protein ACK4M3_07300, partial [Pyrobaculum sp.]
ARWEKLMAWAEKGGNSHKVLEFKEKLVECIVYTAREMISRGKIKDATQLIKYGKEVAKKFAIEELNFHISLMEKEISKILERRKVQTR